jgi:hypothetical protein
MTRALALGVGTLTLKLRQDKGFVPGDVIDGLVTLELGEPLEGSRLVVGVDARQRIVAPGPAIRRAVVWRLERGLVKATTFESLSKRFTLRLPADLDPVVPANAATLGLVTSRAAPKPVPLEWSVFAYLERPWAAAAKVRAPIEVALPRRRARPLVRAQVG